MQVEKINYSNEKAFSAQRVAIAKVKLPHDTILYDIYNLSIKDEKNLEKLKAKIDLKSLWTNLQQKDYETWSFIKDKALTVRGFNKFAFLLTSNNKPCGAMSGSNIWGKCNLNYISTWPIEQNKKMPLAGKVLLLNLFKTVLKTDNLEVVLTALKGDPFQAFMKYKALKFKPCGGDGNGEEMKIKVKDIPAVIEEYANLIDIEAVEDEEIDLLNFI